VTSISELNQRDQLGRKLLKRQEEAFYQKGRKSDLPMKGGRTVLGLGTVRVIFLIIGQLPLKSSYTAQRPGEARAGKTGENRTLPGKLS